MYITNYIFLLDHRQKNTPTRAHNANHRLTFLPNLVQKWNDAWHKIFRYLLNTESFSVLPKSELYFLWGWLN